MFAVRPRRGECRCLPCFSRPSDAAPCGRATFVRWWALGLCPPVGCRDWCCWERAGVRLRVDTRFRVSELLEGGVAGPCPGEASRAHVLGWCCRWASWGAAALGSLCPREPSGMPRFIARSRCCLLPSFVTLGWLFGVLARILMRFYCQAPQETLVPDVAATRRLPLGLVPQTPAILGCFL